MLVEEEDYDDELTFEDVCVNTRQHRFAFRVSSHFGIVGAAMSTRRPHTAAVAAVWSAARIVDRKYYLFKSRDLIDRRN
jgi:hypothetical protein